MNHVIIDVFTDWIIRPEITSQGPEAGWLSEWLLNARPCHSCWWETVVYICDELNSEIDTETAVMNCYES